MMIIILKNWDGWGGGEASVCPSVIHFMCIYCGVLITQCVSSLIKY